MLGVFSNTHFFQRLVDSSNSLNHFFVQLDDTTSPCRCWRFKSGSQKKKRRCGCLAQFWMWNQLSALKVLDRFQPSFFNIFWWSLCTGIFFTVIQKSQETCRCDFWKNVLQLHFFFGYHFLDPNSMRLPRWHFKQRCNRTMAMAVLLFSQRWGTSSCPALKPLLGIMACNPSDTPAQGLVRKTAWGVIDVAMAWEDHSTTQEDFTSLWFIIKPLHDLILAYFSSMRNHNQSANFRYVICWVESCELTWIASWLRGGKGKCVIHHGDWGNPTQYVGARASRRDDPVGGWKRWWRRIGRCLWLMRKGWGMRTRDSRAILSWVQKAGSHRKSCVFPWL